MVADPMALTPVPRDGVTMGEVMLRGNTVMKGYLRNPAATEEALPRRLAPHGRPGGLAPGRLHRDQGPVEGHHHLGRRERLVARGRGGPLPAPGRHGGGRRGEARPAVGGDALRLRHPPAGRGARHGRRHHRVVPRAPRPLQGAARRWCSGPSPRPRPGRSRNTSCASRRRRWIDMNIASILARKGGRVVTCRPEQSIRQALALAGGAQHRRARGRGRDRRAVGHAVRARHRPRGRARRAAVRRARSARS